MENTRIIEHIRSMAEKHQKPSEILRYLAIDLEMEDQVNMMKLFSEALNVSLGEVTAIAGWWHETPTELNDKDIDAYLKHIIDDFATSSV